MTESTGQGGTGGQIGSANQAAGGTPTESEAPELAGLGSDLTDPTDPESEPEPAQRAPFDPGADPGDATGASDPMPDSSGTSGS